MLHAIASMENMDTMLETDIDVNDVSMEEVMFDIWEAEQEITAVSAELADMDSAYTQAEAAVEELKTLAASIEEFGISKPVMQTVDPSASLVSRGIVADYDELEITPVKDANATAAVEGLGDTIKNLWNKLIAFFKKIGGKIAEFYRKVMRGFKSYEKAIIAMIKKLEDATIDESKFGDIKVKALSLSDAKDRDKTLEKVFNNAKGGLLLDKAHAAAAGALKSGKMSDVDAAKADVVKSLDFLSADDVKKAGLEIKMSGSGKDKEVKSVAKVKSSYVVKADNLKSLKYTVSGTIDFLKSTYKKLRAFDAMSKALEAIDKTYSADAKALGDEMKVIGNDDADTQKAKNKASSLMRDCNSYERAIIGWVLTIVRSDATSALGVSKKMLGAKKK